jgi:hypothetical protein
MRNSPPDCVMRAGKLQGPMTTGLFGAWNLVLGIWCLGFGTWDLVRGIWCSDFVI